MQALAGQLEQQYPDENKGRTVSLVPLQEARMSPNERGVFVMTSAFLLAVVALVLLIACVNLANLLLAATVSRRREIGVRVALGATRKRLVRQLLTESLVLSLTGGILGLLLAWWGTRSLWALRPPSPVPIFLDLTPNGRVLAFTIAVSLVTGLAFGLAPALRASAGDVVASLKDEAAFGSGPRRFRLRSALVVSQVCVSLVVLIAATLFVRSVQKIQTIEPGFRVDDVLVISLEPGLYGYGEDRSRALYRRVTERARELPGVRSAALAARLPMSGGTGRTVVAEGRERQGAGERVPLVQTNIVGAGYFETIGIPILQGRDFSDRDVAGAPRVAIVNETMAKRYWPKEPALGKRFQVLEHRYYCEVVGIARDSKYVSPSEPAQPFFYLPLEQQFAPAMNLHLRTRGDPAAVADVVRSEIQRLDDNVSIFDVRPLRRHLAATLWMPRLGAALLGFFGMLGLLLTVVGLYGVLASSVAQRTHEIGVRMALGARARDVLGMVMKEGLLLVVVGLALGLAAALAVTRALSRLLYGVSATDPATFAGAAAVLIVVGALASYLPAKGATRADPMVALRSE
jgi:putative ABC transport system permease protein